MFDTAVAGMGDLDGRGDEIADPPPAARLDRDRLQRVPPGVAPAEHRDGLRRVIDGKPIVAPATNPLLQGAAAADSIASPRSGIATPLVSQSRRSTEHAVDPAVPDAPVTHAVPGSGMAAARREPATPSTPDPEPVRGPEPDPGTGVQNGRPRRPASWWTT